MENNFQMSLPEVHFQDLEEAVCGYLKKYDGALVCSAWINNQKILDVLSTLGHTELVTSKQNTLDSTSRNFQAKLVESLKDSFLKIYLWPKSPEHSGLMHHKFIVFLENKTPKALWTGSCNFTEASKNNAENGVYLEDAKIAHEYQKQFYRLVGEGLRL